MKNKYIDKFNPTYSNELYGYNTLLKDLVTLSQNENIQCPNPECDVDETSITYIKYDDKDMKYLYVCDSCGQKWKNQID